MLEELTTTCEAANCDRPLEDDDCMLAFHDDKLTRRAYECDCGAVTVTVCK